MSWDIYIQDLPEGAMGVDEIPEDFTPAPLGPRETVVVHIHAAFPGIVLDEDGFGCFENEHGSVEIQVGDTDPCESVALFVRGDEGLVSYVRDAVRRLGNRAIDTGAESGLWDSDKASAAFERWREYRDSF